ncbi:MAG: glycosyl hydrolase family 28-related protein [Thermodesulfovibrionales bacterium]
MRSFGAVGDGVTDDAKAIDDAEASAAASGKQVYAPAGTYLLGTTSPDADSHYAYITPKSGVSIYGDGIDRTIFKIKAGENARFAGTTGPNVIATKSAAPLSNATFSDFTVDWNGANNLLTALDTARNNAAIFSLNGGINILVERVKVRTTPGNQCIFFPAFAAGGGQKNITIRDCVFEDNGSGLTGNYNADHSSVYCNGSNLLYEGNRFSSSGPMVNGAAWEIHGSNSIAQGNTIDNYVLGMWIASNYEAISDIDIHDNHATNISAAFSISAGVEAVNNVKVHHNTFKQATGLSYGATTYFVNGNTIVSCDRLAIYDNEFIGQGYTNQFFMQHYKIAELRLSGNKIKNFWKGLTGSGLDIGGSKVADSIHVAGNEWNDVAQAIYFNNPTLAVTSFEVLGNQFVRSASDSVAPVTLSASSSAGNISGNDFSTNYTTLLAGTMNGAKFVHYKEGTWTPAIVGGTTAGTGTYTKQEGQYTWRGNRVEFNATITWTAHTGTGQIWVSLPVVPVNAGTATQMVALGVENITLTAGKFPVAMVVTTVGLALLYEQQSAGAMGVLTLGAAGTVYVSGTYTVSPP